MKKRTKIIIGIAVSLLLVIIFFSLIKKDGKLDDYRTFCEDKKNILYDCETDFNRKCKTSGEIDRFVGGGGGPADYFIEKISCDCPILKTWNDEKGCAYFWQLPFIKIESAFNRWAYSSMY